MFRVIVKAHTFRAEVFDCVSARQFDFFRASVGCPDCVLYCHITASILVIYAFATHRNSPRSYASRIARLFAILRCITRTYLRAYPVAVWMMHAGNTRNPSIIVAFFAMMREESTSISVVLFMRIH